VRISLEFASSHTTLHRARLGYAFSLYCAIYGHEPIPDAMQASSADLCISYNDSSISRMTGTLRLSDRYRTRSPKLAAPRPERFEREAEITWLFYSPAPGFEPDWLAEIFEWVSCADEYSITERDGAGRVPFSASYIGRHKLDPRIPYAAVAMRFLQRAICRLVPGCAEEPKCPDSTVRHFVVNTHDVDFLPVSRVSSLHRLLKNSVISLLERSPGLATRQFMRAISVSIGGSNVLDQMPALLEGQAERQIGASYYFICAKGHRRDANYDVHDAHVIDIMRSLELAQKEVGVHGSYRSLEVPSGLATEFDTLRRVGFYPVGGRQHWLRFTLEGLIPALEGAGATYDASLGWSNTIGFRAGACFAFPPYDFEREHAVSFLEIPLAIMDRCLWDERNSYEAVAKLLAVSRKYAWGGASMLWHPTAFKEGQFPERIGQVYWRLADARHEQQDTWVSAATFVSRVWRRYADAGLLPGRESTHAVC
jgi:hypothetical protein